MQMKTPQVNLNTIKDVLKKLSFLKNNLALLVPILIVIVAVLLFIPTRLLSGKLKATINQQSVKMATDIDRLIRDVNEAGQAEAMEGYVNAYKQDANQIENLMLQTTMRELLTYKLFPDTNETSPLLFEPVRRDYLAGVDAMIQRLGAGVPPADADIQAALEKSPSRSRYGRGQSGGAYGGGAYGGGAYGGGAYGGGAYGAGGGLASSYRMMSEIDRKIVDKLCEDKARAIRIYASPADLDGYSFWSDWKFENWDTAVRQCWNWQMGYWMLEDITDTVVEMNKSSSSVLDAPVKRVMAASFAFGRQASRMVGRRGRPVRREGDMKLMPTYVINLKTAMAAPPCTGRFCSEEADVMHFNLRVIVAAHQVMPFIQELCSAKTHKFRGWYGDQPEQTFKHNQITVLESNVIPIDLEDYEHSAYRYGGDPVVELDLICEYLFPKAADPEDKIETYEDMKPQVIKDDIAGVSAEGTN